jgi:hypothetical protein
MLGITINRLRYIKKSAAYLRARMKITLGLIVDNDSELAQIKAQRREALVASLPSALRVIAEAVHMPAFTLAERKFQFEAAQDVLDREGTFTKVSRSEVSTKPGFDWSTGAAHSTQILNILAVGEACSEASVADLLGIVQQAQTPSAAAVPEREAP